MCVQNRALFRVQPTWLFILKFLDMMLWYEMDWRWTEEWKNWKKERNWYQVTLIYSPTPLYFSPKTKLLPLLFCVNFKSSYIIIYILFNFSAIDVCHKLKKHIPNYFNTKNSYVVYNFWKMNYCMPKTWFLSVLSKAIFLCLTRCC